MRPQRVERPATVDAVRRAVAAAAAQGLRVKAVGAGHSFSGVAVAPGVLLDLADLSGLISVDRQCRQARVLAGTTLHRLSALLAPHGLALTNLGDIDRQTLAGAISTGTHGTGAEYGGLATQVVGATLVTTTGDLLEIDHARNADLLPAVAVGLGALGVLVDVTVQCVPAFLLRADEKPEPLDDVLASLEARAAASDHFELYWFSGTDRAMTKTNTRLPADAPRRPLSPVARFVDERVLTGAVLETACLLGRAVPASVGLVNDVSVRLWGDRQFTDRSHRVFASRRSVRFREMEYALPAHRASAAFDAVREMLAARRWRITFPIEVRFGAADELWLSPATGRATAYIAVHRYWREDPRAYFDAVEEIMLAHDGRPHWGKLHSLDAAALRPRYPRFDDFVALRDRLDPDRVFANPHLERVLGG